MLSHTSADRWRREQHVQHVLCAGKRAINPEICERALRVEWLAVVGLSRSSQIVKRLERETQGVDDLMTARACAR